MGCNTSKVGSDALVVPGAAHRSARVRHSLLSDAKLERLRTLKLFVLDNSVRETTVAQMRGHTLEDKYRIMALVRDCGLRHQIIGTFAAQRRVDDDFARRIVHDPSFKGQRLYVFAEVHEPSVPHPYPAAGPTLDCITWAPTVGLTRAAEYGVCNVVLEMDTRDPWLGKDEATAGVAIAVLHRRLEWIRSTFGRGNSKVFLNLRDFVPANEGPSTLGPVVDYLCRLPEEDRIAGILFEDPTGACFPSTLGTYVARLRRRMVANGWAHGLIALHVHNGFGLAEACVLEGLASGADGIWCGIAREGAASGHANSLTTIVNLQRLGNEDARKRFNVALLRNAAIDITVICTGAPPHPQMELYGARALDVCFDTTTGMGAAAAAAAGDGAGDGYDLASALAVQPQIRVTTMCTPLMLAQKLGQVFGPPPANAVTEAQEAEEREGQAGRGRKVKGSSSGSSRDGTSSATATTNTAATGGGWHTQAVDTDASITAGDATRDGAGQLVVAGQGRHRQEEEEVGRTTTDAALLLLGKPITATSSPSTAAATDPYGGWDPAVMRQMWANVNRDLTSGVKEEYDSPEGLERLFVRSGGAPFPAMQALLASRAALLAQGVAHPALEEAKARFRECFGGTTDGELGRAGVAPPTHASFLRLVAHLPDYASSPALSTALCRLCEVCEEAGAAPVISLDVATNRLLRVVGEYGQECTSLDAAWCCIARRLLTPALVAHKRRAMWNKRARLLRAYVRMVSATKTSKSKEQGAGVPGAGGGTGEGGNMGEGSGQGKPAGPTQSASVRLPVSLRSLAPGKGKGSSKVAPAPPAGKAVETA